MKVTPEIVLKGVEMTPLIDKSVAKGIAKLEQVCDYIIGTRIAVEQVQGRHQTGNLYRVRIEIRVPGWTDIVVKRSSKESKKGLLLEDKVEPESPQPIRHNSIPIRKTREEPLPALVRRTFDSARREIEKVVDRQHGKVKIHPQQQITAIVEKIFRERQYGFLRTLDGQEVYFHRNSVLHRHWENLKVGTTVRYTPEVGEKGLQASTVEPIGKSGGLKIHNHLHDLPIES